MKVQQPVPSGAYSTIQLLGNNLLVIKNCSRYRRFWKRFSEFCVLFGVNISPFSIEYRTEKDDLNKLIEYHKHIKGKVNAND